MRVLCLRFPEMIERPWVEAFLRLTPHIAFKPPRDLFLEVSATQHLFGGEQALLALAAAVAERLVQTPVNAAIADRAATAQVLAVHRPGTRTERELDERALGDLPVEAIADLAGLTPWPTEPLRLLIRFLESMGFRHLSELQRLERHQLQERWGELGINLWKRLHGREEEVISPWRTREPLLAYAYFEEGISHLGPLEQQLNPLLEHLFLRLEGLGLFARSLTATLRCEWSRTRHQVSVEPVTPSRDLGLFKDLLLNKLAQVDFHNPVQEMDLEIVDVPERLQQLDFFEPRERGESKWQRLMSFAAQGGVEMGFLQMQPALFAEQTVVFRPAEPQSVEWNDRVEQSEEGIQIRPSYSKDLSQAPRPSLLLDPPREIDIAEAQGYRKLTSIPAERVVGSWWKPQPEEGRDYYYALSPEGRLLWIFRDRLSRKYFLHGAFD